MTLQTFTTFVRANTKTLTSPARSSALARTAKVGGSIPSCDKRKSRRIQESGQKASGGRRATS